MNTIKINMDEINVLENICKRKFKINKLNEKHLKSLINLNMVIKNNKKYTLSGFGVAVFGIAQDKMLIEEFEKE